MISNPTNDCNAPMQLKLKVFVD